MASAALNVNRIRGDFPILKRKFNGKPLAYLDSASTSQKPKPVIDAVADYYTNHNANIHRGVHTLSAEATELFEAAHAKAAKLVNADFEELVFTSGTTHSMNLLSYSLASRIRPGDEIVLTQLEHHSNLLPWQQLALRYKAKLKYLPLTPTGNLDMAAAACLITRKTKIVTATHVSNVLGTIVPIRKLAKLAHANDAVLVVDAAQSVPHLPVDVKALDVDFLAFSGHKMLAPTGTGGLYGRKALLEGMPPFFTGGDMIKEVSWEHATWNDLPWKFEAGTPNIGGAVGMAAAIDYLQGIGLEKIERHERALAKETAERLSKIPGVTIYGPRHRAGIVSFNVEGVHAHDVATILDREAIAIRGGHHCAMPLHSTLGIAGSARASFAPYNTTGEIDRLVAAIGTVKKVFRLK